MREKTLETRLKREIEKRGGKCWKFASPGTDGVPDRIIMLPGGVICFVEIKAPGKTLRPLQRKRSEELQKLGVKTYCIDTITGMEDMIDEITRISGIREKLDN